MSRILCRAGLIFSRKTFRERRRYILSHITLNRVYIHIHITYKEEIAHEMRWPARRSNHPRPVCLLTAILGIVLMRCRARPIANDKQIVVSRSRGIRDINRTTCLEESPTRWLVVSRDGLVYRTARVKLTRQSFSCQEADRAERTAFRGSFSCYIKSYDVYKRVTCTFSSCAHS